MKEGRLGLACRFSAWMAEGKVELGIEEDARCWLVIASEMKIVGRAIDTQV